MNGIVIKDLDETIRCSKRIIDHIKRKQAEESSNLKNKSLPQENIKLSEQEKCFRSTLVRMGLFMFCSLGLGKHICESYDIIKDEEKKLGRKLNDNEFHEIVIKVAMKYNFIPMEEEKMASRIND